MINHYVTPFACCSQWISPVIIQFGELGRPSLLNVPFYYLCSIFNNTQSLCFSIKQVVFSWASISHCCSRNTHAGGMRDQHLVKFAIRLQFEESHETWETWHAERSSVGLIKLLHEWVVGYGEKAQPCLHLLAVTDSIHPPAYYPTAFLALSNQSGKLPPHCLHCRLCELHVAGRLNYRW